MAKALFRVLSRALGGVAAGVCAAMGSATLLSWGCWRRLRWNRRVAWTSLNAALGMELQHLLVDEMQDTSTSQYELLELLTQGWDGQSQTVFLVGDPKQSIYLFRQARVERFVRMMKTQMLGDLPLGTLRLTANFRSQRELVDAFNEDFSVLFPRETRRRVFGRGALRRGPGGARAARMRSEECAVACPRVGSGRRREEGATAEGDGKRRSR